MLAYVNKTLLSPAGEVKGKHLLMGKVTSLPTAPVFIAPAQQDLDKEKHKLISLLKKITEQKMTWVTGCMFSWKDIRRGSKPAYPQTYRLPIAAVGYKAPL